MSGGITPAAMTHLLGDLLRQSESRTGAFGGARGGMLEGASPPGNSGQTK
jgi:hypothetical protein